MLVSHRPKVLSSKLARVAAKWLERFHLLWVPVLFLLYAVIRYCSNIKYSIEWPSLHGVEVSYELLISLAVVILLFALKRLSLFQLQRAESAAIPDWDRDTSSNIPKSEITVRNARQDELKKLVSFLQFYFPPSKFSGYSHQDRQIVLQRLWNTWKESVKIIIHTPQEGLPTLIGCSVIAPLKKENYWHYRHHRAEGFNPFQWSDTDFEDHGVTADLFLYSQYIFCCDRGKGWEGDLLREVFLDHVAEICSITHARGVSIIGPRKSRRGGENMRTLGAELRGTNMKGFPVYELDLRRREELGKNAMRTLDEIMSRLPVTDRARSA